MLHSGSSFSIFLHVQGCTVNTIHSLCKRGAVSLSAFPTQIQEYNLSIIAAVANTLPLNSDACIINVPAFSSYHTG